MGFYRVVRRYMGVAAQNPPEMKLADRAPLTTDLNYPIGTLWVDEANDASYQLTSVASNSANWELLGSATGAVATLSGDSGTATPAAGNIEIAGGTNITTAAAADTITVNLDADITVDSVSSSGDISITGAASKYELEGGAVTDFIGQATLVSGTVTVANTNIAATDRIFVTRAGVGASTDLGVLNTSISAATSFTITSLIPGTPGSTQTGDLSTVNYFIVRQL